MKRLLVVLLFALIVPAAAEAQTRWGARVGLVDGEAMIGADAIIKLAGPWYFNPGVEVSSKLVSTNADLHYDIDLMRDAAFWVGAGVALINPEEQDLTVGLNVLAGIGVNRSGRIFYSQLKVTQPTGDLSGYTTVAVGMRF